MCVVCGMWHAGSQQAVHPVEALLAVAAHPNDELAAMSFNFWHRLSRHLTSSFGAQPAVSATISLDSYSHPWLYAILPEVISWTASYLMLLGILRLIIVDAVGLYVFTSFTVWCSDQSRIYNISYVYLLWV